MFFSYWVQCKHAIIVYWKTVAEENYINRLANVVAQILQINYCKELISQVFIWKDSYDQRKLGFINHCSNLMLFHIANKG